MLGERIDVHVVVVVGADVAEVEVDDEDDVVVVSWRGKIAAIDEGIIVASKRTRRLCRQCIRVFNKTEPK
jgi:hypothetical protein